jgi:hypothetical protein
VTRTLALLLLFAGGLSAQSTPGAKAMFYSPGALAPNLQSAHIGIRYWFEDVTGLARSERRIATAGGPHTLHIRGNTSAFISIWDMDTGIELMSRTTITGGTRLGGGEELVIPDVFELAAGAPERRIIVVWGRAQTEQAGRASGARQRLSDLTSRAGRDGAPQVVRESDDTTPGQIGTYVINREGMPVATELVFRAR